MTGRAGGSVGRRGEGNFERVESSSLENVQATGRNGGTAELAVVLSGGSSLTLSPLGVEGPEWCAGNADSDRVISVVSFQEEA